MFFIVAVQGCLPYLDVISDQNGEAIGFETEEKADRYAKKNCAWEYQIVQF
jgi:hypothetical protein